MIWFLLAWRQEEERGHVRELALVLDVLLNWKPRLDAESASIASTDEVKNGHAPASLGSLFFRGRPAACRKPRRFSFAISTVSFGSMLMVSTSKSRPTCQSICLSAFTRP